MGLENIRGKRIGSNGKFGKKTQDPLIAKGAKDGAPSRK
jgi:hypothetical protein